ncbi:type I polyketide synthase [candidate division KSB1 bacterium]|nr:type I polyketide synthase [candidate division KSB1 bacterium]
MSSPQPKDHRDLLKRALLKIDNLQAQLDKQHEPIAVIGMSLRFPNGANDPEQFWQVLRDGVDCITEIPANRWNVEDYYDPDPNAPGKMYTRCAGFIDNVDRFDPQFFGIAPREAQSMDPQQRLLLEVTWEALERAGQAPSKLAGSRTGVYVGISGNDYSHLHSTAGGSEHIDTYFGAGVAHSIASGRISYVLGLQGPSVSVDTACSASLTAVHLACQSLRASETDMALAGGVNVILSPDGIITASQARMLSPEGRCKTFDASANGYVRSEGCAIIVLKRLSDALANGDNILALIRGTAANQDGRSGGLTAPNGEAQQAVIREALANAKLKSEDISYLETHGTGTALGDPIEVQAIGAVFGASHSKEHPLLIGAVKSNIGHLEAAAGIAGLVKTILALQHQKLPPSLHVRQLNPHIAWEKLPVRVTTELTPWVAHEGKRIAGVSSFGFSGTNVHVVVEAWENRENRRVGEVAPSPLHRLLALSAKNDAALRELAKNYAQHFAANTEHSLADVAFTANAGRAHFNHRIALVAETREQARAQLAAFVVDEKPAGLQCGKIEDGHRAEVAFLCTGQGAQYHDMGKQLYETQPVFRAALDKCGALLRSYLEKPLLSVLYPEMSAEQSDTPIKGGIAVETQLASGVQQPATNNQQLTTNNLLDQTAYTQPALFAIEYALAELWRSWGIAPSYVMGHSVGEYVAACVAGVFSLEDGLKLIATRARLMQALPQNGSMAAVFAHEETVRKAVMTQLDKVDVAAINGPENVVISGAREAVDEILRQLESEGHRNKPLVVSHAFHSPLMEPMLDEFERIASEIKYSAPRIPLLSNLTGQFVADDEMTSARYWRKHVREAVRFAEAMATLQEHACKIFVEIGPSPTLLSMGQRCLPEHSAIWLPSLRKGRDDWQQMLETLAGLYAQGVNVDWENFHRDQALHRVVLPTYPFQRQRYWSKAAERHEKSEDRESKIVSSRSSILNPQSSILHPLLGQRLRSALQEIQFETVIDLNALPFLREHQFQGTPVMPMTAFVEMALAAAREVYGHGTHVLEQCVIHEALLLPEEETRVVQFILLPENETQSAFRIFGASMNVGGTQTQWRLHASGRLHVVNASDDSRADLATLRQRCSHALDMSAYYERCRVAGIALGPRFQILAQTFAGDDEALTRVQAPAAHEEQYCISPEALAACLQLSAALRQNNEAGVHDYVPVGFDRMSVYRERLSTFWCHTTLRERSNAEVWACDIVLYDDEGRCSARIDNVQFRRWQNTKIADWFYEVEWQPQALTAAEESNVAAQKWLLFADSSGLAVEVAAQLRERKASAVCVYAGESFARINENEWRVNPDRSEDFGRLLQEAGMPHGIIHSWSLAAVHDDSLPAEKIMAEAKLLCGSVLHLVQACLRAHAVHMPRLCLLTRGAQAVERNHASPLQPVQTALWGLANVIALEHPTLQCRCFDLDPTPTLTASEEAARLLHAIVSNPREQKVAWRKEQRYCARIVPLASSEQEKSIQQHATYLITGGLGALGLHVAKCLAENGAQHIVLLGRRAPSAKAQTVIASMKQMGANIVVAALDLTQENEVRRLLDEIATTLPPLRGIIHAAGVLDDGVLVQQDWSRFERVLAPKVIGAWHLHRLTRELPLDFFVLFSSIASMFGAASQSNYAAANAFMDGLAHYRRAKGLHAISINWGPWAEGGMVTEQGARTAQRLAQQGLQVIAPEQGVHALQRLLGGTQAQAGVLPVHWRKFLAQYQNSDEPALFAHMRQIIFPHEQRAHATANRISILEKLNDALPAERFELLTAHVREQVVQVLGLDTTQTPALHQGLTALGMDSLMAVELSNRLRASLGRALPATLAFEFPSIAALTQYLATEVLQWDTSGKVETKSNDAQSGKANIQQEIEQIAEGKLEDSLLQELEEAGY